MTDSKRCVKCQRPIDAISTICPFCNWDQTQPAPPPEVLAAPSPAAALYKPPDELRMRKAILIAAGIVVMLVGAFSIGMIINSDDTPAKAPESLEQQAAEYNAENQKPKRADTPLVPVGVGGIDQQPITSVPMLEPQGNMPNEYQRTDATAVSSAEYAQLASRAQAEKAQKKRDVTTLDPRSISGPAYAQAPPMPPRRASGASNESAPASSYAKRAVTRAVRTTRPIAEYQPVPRIYGRGKARLTLIVGTDGRVHDVNIERTLPGGNTAALIGAVQRWRFKPATVNGEPVAAPYSVEISFGRE